MRTTPYLDAADSDLLRDVIRHHDELIGRLLETAAGRRRELIRDGAEPPAASVLLSPTQLDALRGRFEFVLEVRCELGSRPPARG